MSDILEAIILGIVQGLTEFLPVSSSGHLEIFKFLLGTDSVGESSLLTTVMLHFATALATIFVFRSDILKILKGVFDSKDTHQKQFIVYIMISMVPAVFVGLYFEEIIESLFNENLLLVGLSLLFTAFLLWISERLSSTSKNINLKNSFLIGIGQAIAILPGVSRSGATIACSLLLGIEKEQAARFSFLMVVPLIFGKVAKDLLSGDMVAATPDWIYLILGFIAAFFSGAWACTTMIKIVKSSRLYWFSLYCLIIGIATILISVINQ